MTVGYHVPSVVAVTTALAAGGGLPGGSPPPGATAIDFPIDRTPQTVAGGATLTITLPAVTNAGMITGLGVNTTDIVNTRITTFVNGVQTGPLNQAIGAVGTMDAPTIFGAPIVLQAGDVFSVELENLDVGNEDMSARIIGWSF